MSDVFQDIAARERTAAVAGYETWIRFVRDAETRTGLPWREIRERINPYVAALIKREEYERRILS